MTLPLPGVPSPVATNAAVPPALMLLPLCWVLSSVWVVLLDCEPQLSSILASGFWPLPMLVAAPPIEPNTPPMPSTAAIACSAEARPFWLLPAASACCMTFWKASSTGDFTASVKPELLVSWVSSWCRSVVEASMVTFWPTPVTFWAATTSEPVRCRLRPACMWTLPSVLPTRLPCEPRTVSWLLSVLWFVPYEMPAPALPRPDFLTSLKWDSLVAVSAVAMVRSRPADRFTSPVPAIVAA